MQTAYYKNEIKDSAEILKNGGLVAVPTETVYGLAGNGLDEAAVDKIYEVKGRPAVKPLSLMVPGPEAMDNYCEDVCKEARLLAEHYWPGPLTIILKSKELVPLVVRAGGATVGLRCPDSGLTLQLLREAGIPLAVPSANPSGQPSPKNAEKVMEYFNGKIEAVIDGGACQLGKESTIIDMSARPFRILREAALSKEEIADFMLKNIPVIGITGGTGVGKSTALEALKDRGALVLDCDIVYHELLESGGEMLAEIKEAFPDAFEGSVFKRKKLGSIVFADAALLEKLNAITHKYVTAEILSRLRAFALSGGKIVAIDAIELISSGVSSLCTLTVAVSADRELRIGRIMERDSISREYAEARVDAQHDDAYFKANCDKLIYNNSTPEEFRAEFNRIIDEVI